MAAVRRSKFSYLLTNFAQSVVNPASRFYKTRKALYHCSSIWFAPEQEIKMPSLSPTMVEGKIVKWLKKEGDPITAGDILCDIETDKAIVSMEIEEEGILAKILVPENAANIKVGSLIALMVSEGEDWQNVKFPTSSSSRSSDSSSETNDLIEKVNEQEVKITGPSNTPIKMPSLSPTMTTGTIVKWQKQEGDKIKAGDVLCDIQTDKAIVSMETEEEGVLAKIIVPNDSKDVEVGTIIAVIVPEGEDWKSIHVEPSERIKDEAKSQPTAVHVGSEVKGKSFGPAVKSLLTAYQIEPGLIKPTGRKNRLLKEDVLKYISDNNLEKKPPKPVSGPSASLKTPSTPKSIQTQKSKNVSNKYTDIEITNMRQIIAKRLVQSKIKIPHSYSIIKCNIDNLLKEKEILSAENVKISVNDLLTKAVALALKIYPKVNALYINNEVKLSHNVDICVAVATDMGLYTPIIKNANLKNIINISKEIKELSSKAKSGKLQPEEFQGGTFTISNLGMFGITHFKAIINPPQCAILAVGGAIKSLSPELAVEKNLILSLSFDRRAVEENEAAEFMNILKYFVENPKLITVDANQSMEMKL